MATIIDWPDALRPARVDWGLFVPQLVGRSAFDGSVQANTLGAPRWFCEIDSGPLRRDEVPQWEALMQRLRGKVNRLRMWDWRREAPLGIATGTPLVRVAGTGATIATKGWTASTAGILKAGSYMGINGELKRLSVDMNSDGSGFSTAAFEPPLRATAPVDGAIVLVKPTALFILTTDRPSMAQQGARYPGWTLGFDEVFL
jgi:hypothetical protein